MSSSTTNQFQQTPLPLQPGGSSYLAQRGQLGLLRPPPQPSTATHDVPPSGHYPSLPLLPHQPALVYPPFVFPPSGVSPFWSSPVHPTTPNYLDPHFNYFQPPVNASGFPSSSTDVPSSSSRQTTEQPTTSAIWSNTFASCFSVGPLDAPMEDDDNPGDRTVGSPSALSGASPSIAPPVSNDGESEESFKAVDEEEEEYEEGCSLRKGKTKRRRSDPKKSGDEKGTTIAQVLSEMGLTRAAYDKMTPFQKRQIRNKVSARAFRARKKSLIETLSAEVEEKDGIIERLGSEILWLERENLIMKVRQ